MPKSIQEIATEIGKMVEVKNASYGSAYEKIGEFLHILYPHGVKPYQYADMLVLTRIFDKMMRIANRRNAFGEDPYRDIVGYGILGVKLHELDGVPDCCPEKTTDPKPANTTYSLSGSHEIDFVPPHIYMPIEAEHSAPPSTQGDRDHLTPSEKWPGE